MTIQPSNNNMVERHDRCGSFELVSFMLCILVGKKKGKAQEAQHALSFNPNTGIGNRVKNQSISV